MLGCFAETIGDEEGVLGEREQRVVIELDVWDGAGNDRSGHVQVGL